MQPRVLRMLGLTLHKKISYSTCVMIDQLEWLNINPNLMIHHNELHKHYFVNMNNCRFRTSECHNSVLMIMGECNIVLFITLVSYMSYKTTNKWSKSVLWFKVWCILHFQDQIRDAIEFCGWKFSENCHFARNWNPSDVLSTLFSSNILTGFLTVRI